MCRSLKVLSVVYVFNSFHCTACQIPVLQTLGLVSVFTQEMKKVQTDIDGRDCLPDAQKRGLVAPYIEHAMYGSCLGNCIFVDACAAGLLVRAFAVGEWIWLQLGLEAGRSYFEKLVALLEGHVRNHDTFYPDGYYLPIGQDIEELLTAFGIPGNGCNPRQLQGEMFKEIGSPTSRTH